MSYPAKAIANAFIARSMRDGNPVSNMKLQKLLYFAHAMYLATHGKPLICEPPEAWQYGPVFPSIYHEFKNFGSRPIDCFATDLDVDELEIRPVQPPANPELKAFLDSIWKTYGSQSATQLSALSHIPGGPWKRVREEFPASMSADIPDDYIRDFYSAALRRVVRKQQDAA
jgi:uncharacterized phage-associated protein